MDVKLSQLGAHAKLFLVWTRGHLSQFLHETNSVAYPEPIILFEIHLYLQHQHIALSTLTSLAAECAAVADQHC